MKKFSLKNIMKRAWEIKKQDSQNLFSLCLKMAWSEAKAPKKAVKKGGRTMKLNNIKNGFYTDGENLYSNICGQVCIWLKSTRESNDFLSKGTDVARAAFSDPNMEVKPAKAGMSFCNGEITVIDKNTIQGIEIRPINPKYNGRGCCIGHDGYKKHTVSYNSKFEKVNSNLIRVS